MTWVSVPKKIVGGDSVTSGFCGVFGSTGCADVLAVAVAPSGTARDGAGVVADGAPHAAAPAGGKAGDLGGLAHKRRRGAAVAFPA